MAKDKEGRQRGTEDSFTGRAAQLAVMAELLRLGCNAAIPEIDLGTDVFAFKDDREEVVRLQVKACTVPHTYVDGSGYSAKNAWKSLPPLQSTLDPEQTIQEQAGRGGPEDTGIPPHAEPD